MVHTYLNHVSYIELKVQCLKGSPTPLFESGIAWPRCDVKDRPKCDNFPGPPAGVPIAITDRTPVLPGGSVFYKCTGFGQVSTIGENIEVLKKG